MKVDIKKLLLEKIKTKGRFTIKDIQEEIDISRQAIHRHIKKLLEEEKIIKIGTTRGAKYIASNRKIETTQRIRRIYSRIGLQEDKILQSVFLSLNLKKQINSNAQEIFSYAFTEILNNAIEHSQSEKILIEIDILRYDITFTIRDYGIGIFYHIKNRLGLPSIEASMQELLKGKVTTDPEQHTGEGLFFTSRSADNLEISSHRSTLVFDNKLEDIFSGAIRYCKGTKVCFYISKNTRRHLDTAFDKYAGKDYDYVFSKTSVHVKLYSSVQSPFVSRSIAKRLLNRLDQFEEIIIDFSGVKMIGQGFADQIFRVFQKQHPHIKIESVNTSEAIQAMISHVVSMND